MPLITELLTEDGKSVSMPWTWADRMTIAGFVLSDGGQVGEAKSIEDGGILNMGYFGAGCDHVFKEAYGFSQVDFEGDHFTRHATIEIKPGMRYREYRA